MSNSQLPERASLEYLKKLAKDRLEELRRADPLAKLAAAQLTVAREHGFPSWRALKLEVDRRQAKTTASFFEACAKGDVEVLSSLLADDPGLVHADDADRPHRGWTALHETAHRGHANAVRLLLRHGAEPNARETGDNTYPLHWAAAKGHNECVRALLDAGGDVHGIGDVHELDTIGWATCFREPDEIPDVAPLLVERGARHHIFSAIALGDLNLIRKLVEDNPEELDRRMSRFEHGQTALHYAINRNRYDVLDLLIELGADMEAEDLHGQTALAVAMLRADQEAVKRLHAAGATQPPSVVPSNFRADMAQLADSIRKCIPMISVPDIARTLEWYTSIGFKEQGRYADGGAVNWGMLSFGKAEFMLVPGGKKGQHDASLWFYTEKIDPLYRLLKSRQLSAAKAALAGETGDQDGIEFVEDIYEPFYGGREFGVRDLNGYNLFFLQPA